MGGFRYVAAAIAVVVIVGIATGSSHKHGSSGGGGEVSGRFKIGLITKTNSNPYFISMLQAAKAEAKKQNVQLIAKAGNLDGDNQSQVEAVEDLVAAQVKAILVVPNDSKGIIPSLEAAQKQGIFTIALDTPTDGNKGVAATYATDNFQAGEFQGEYVKAALNGKTPKIAMLDLEPGVTVGDDRHNGFLKGMGLPKSTKDIAGRGDTNGDQGKGQDIMENLLQKNSDINSVYSINEPAGIGAAQAIKNAGKSAQIVVGSIDGGCTGVKAVKSGQLAATVMQFPGKMATIGVDVSVGYVRHGKKPKMPSSGFVNTGAQLITDKPLNKLPSKTTAWGLQNCWGGGGTK